MSYDLSLVRNLMSWLKKKTSSQHNFVVGLTLHFIDHTFKLYGKGCSRILGKNNLTSEQNLKRCVSHPPLYLSHKFKNKNVEHYILAWYICEIKKNIFECRRSLFPFIVKHKIVAVASLLDVLLSSIEHGFS